MKKSVIKKGLYDRWISFRSAMLVLGIASSGSLSAATVVWIAGDGNWQTAGNWSSGVVPVGSDNIYIDDGATVTYVPGGDLSITGGSLTLENGSTWRQTTTHWTYFGNNSNLMVMDSTFQRTTTGAVVLSRNDNSRSEVTLINSVFEIGGELWFGRDTIGGVEQHVSVWLENSTIKAVGSVGIWFWAAADSSNNYTLNIQGAGSRVEGRVGIRLNNDLDTVTGQDAEGNPTYSTLYNSSRTNSVAWQELWEIGILQYNGSSDGEFSDYFRTEGTVGTTSYALLSIPEPAQSVMLGLLGLSLLRRRRRS